MVDLKKTNFLFNDVSALKGVGKQLSKYLKTKKIEKINDLLWNMPYSYTDRGDLVNLNKLEIGKIATIKVKVIKTLFPRIRNLPNRVICEDHTGKIDIVFFNSREGYIRNVLPLNEWVIISGKVAFFRNKYQITNPDYITKQEKIDYVNKKIPKYSLTEGLNEKSYRKIIEQLFKALPDIPEWHDKNFINNMNFLSWRKSLIEMHNPKKEVDLNSNIYRRLAYDEIFAHFLSMSENRKRIKREKKEPKVFLDTISSKIINNLNFKLTSDQNKVIKEINKDLKSKSRMFRILQGDVGSGKTIVAIIAISNAISAGFQTAFMAPTSILAKQHYDFAKKIFKNTNIEVSLLTGKTDLKIKKIINENIKKGKINLLIGTHSLFQKKILFKKLGLIVVDEQHKFGVKQRMNLAEKGGLHCDVLLMSATPIPRTMILSIYGDMDISKITKKPLNRKKILTLSKPEEKINELWPLVRKKIKNGDQVFWVCPLIDESQHLDYSSAVKKFDTINKLFPGRTGLIYSTIEKDEKEKILKDFLNKKIDILVSTTVIEVGIDFPNANLIIIENANKFGLAQLHQLRGRVGRGTKEAICVLLFKGSPSKNAIKRLKILKSTDDGFAIAEEDMKLRGFGDMIGFQQSGVKFFRIADPIHHEDLFKLAENGIKKIENFNQENKYNFLLKLFDKADIINNTDFN